MVKRYMIIETRDPEDARDADWVAAMASDLRRNGEAASVLLAENGVLAARAGAASPLQDLTDAGCPVFADRFALKARGINEKDLAPGVTPAELDLVIDALNAGAAVVWR
jgi:hypothetical protein